MTNYCTTKLSTPVFTCKLVLSSMIYIYMQLYMYRIQTDARVITGNTTEIKNRGRRPRFFISRLDGNKNRPQVYDVFARVSQLVRDLFEASARTEMQLQFIACSPVTASHKSSDKPSGLFISAFQSEWKVLLLALLVFLPFPRKKRPLLSRR